MGIDLLLYKGSPLYMVLPLYIDSSLCMHPPVICVDRALSTMLSLANVNVID